MKNKNNVIAIVIILVAAFMYRHRIISWITPRHIPSTLVKSGNCEGKKLCGIIYLAPWCPACHQYQPMIVSALANFKNNDEHGIQIIMGMEIQIGENERVAREIGADVIIDHDRKYAKMMNISYFPTFLVADQNHKVKMSDAEALEWFANHAD